MNRFANRSKIKFVFQLTAEDHRYHNNNEDHSAYNIIQEPRSKQIFGVSTKHQKRKS